MSAEYAYDEEGYLWPSFVFVLALIITLPITYSVVNRSRDPTAAFKRVQTSFKHGHSDIVESLRKKEKRKDRKVIWLALVASIWTGFQAARLDLPVVAAWTTLGFLGLGVSLPSSPGFVGVIQAAVVTALRLFGVPYDDALSFSLLFHVSQFVPVTVWGLVLLFVEHVSLAEAVRTQGVPPESTGA